MGITIHFRGTIDAMDRIEEFEDRVLDVAFALGGRGSLWRSYADHDPQRIVRGLLVELSPGQETTSLLLSPEGQLMGFMQIEEAEQTPLDEVPWSSVKTQFGSLDGHAAIVEILAMMKESWFTNLEVSDESGYWDHRDPLKLAEKMTMLRNAIRAMGHALQDYGLSPEAAEDPEILISRIERIAAFVAEKIRNPAKSGSESTAEEHHGEFSDDEIADTESSDTCLEESVAQAERDFHRNQPRSERMIRRIREERDRGATADDALRLAMEAEGLFPDACRVDTGATESWECDDDTWRTDDAETAGEDREEAVTPADPEIFAAAKSLLLEVMQAAPESHNASSFFSIAQQGMMDVLGGLAQATADPDRRDELHCSRTIVQLKRAIRGAGFARGAIFGLRSHDLVEKSTSHRWLEQLDHLIDKTQELLADAWRGSENSD